MANKEKEVNMVFGGLTGTDPCRFFWATIPGWLVGWLFSTDARPDHENFLGYFLKSAQTNLLDIFSQKKRRLILPKTVVFVAVLGELSPSLSFVSGFISQDFLLKLL